jgi:hypothetical protein
MAFWTGFAVKMAVFTMKMAFWINFAIKMVVLRLKMAFLDENSSVSGLETASRKKKKNSQK